jgi:hypothetical protein
LAADDILLPYDISHQQHPKQHHHFSILDFTMVGRKPVGAGPAPIDTTQPSTAASTPLPPYPTTPPDDRPPPAAQSVYSSDLNTSPAFDLIDVDEARQKRRDSDVSSHGTWDSDDTEGDAETPEPDVELPKPLQIRQQNSQAERKDEDLPAILRPGRVKGEDAVGAGIGAHEAQSNNPYHKQYTGVPPSSLAVWEQPVQITSPPSHAAPETPVELPSVRSPTQQVSQLSLDSRAPTDAISVPTPSQSQPFPSTNPWADVKPHSPPPPPKESLPPSLPAVVDDRNQHSDPSGTSPEVTTAPPPPIEIAIPPAAPSTFAPETPRTQERKRNEHYQIKHINWLHHDKMRKSPILTQNENGPCPLLALVNALILSTPADTDTSLVETLRTREQVSLGLLLDAVFDELMSGRRGDAADQLPDVSELYSFLLALHTGMNVNPRFISRSEHVHLSKVTPNKAGCFEETREMRLYSTFHVPLIHGWTAPKGTPVYAAFERNAQTFEDAQNIQFAESELEDQLRAGGLSPQQQQMLEDIHTIKSFLSTWPTQLTDHGIETISQSLLPGQIAILFRNDHFSTLYKEPKHGALMALVTDQGYSSHAEIVWESLVDVNGAASEYFSGDFRSVSHGPATSRPSRDDGGWSRKPQVEAPSSNVPPPLPGPRPTTQLPREQEDHDLALALQLQEEEEEHHRQVEERRRREQTLSEQFISTDGERPPAVPPRRDPRTSPSPGVNASPTPGAPPTYEQSASDRPFRPNQGHHVQQPSGQPGPAVSSIPSGGPYGRRRRSSHRQTSSTPGGGRVNQAATVKDTEEKCVVM